MTGSRRYTLAWLTVVAALGVATLVLGLTDHGWLLASLGGSCVILFGMPESDMAQPRSLIGGHALATLAGLAFLRLAFSISAAAPRPGWSPRWPRPWC